MGPCNRPTAHALTQRVPRGRGHRCVCPNLKVMLTAVGAMYMQVVSLATVEPEGASQGAQQVLSSASVPFNGCNGTAAAVPSITINGLKMINFTTFTWTLNHSAVTSSQVTVIGWFSGRLSSSVAPSSVQSLCLLGCFCSLFTQSALLTPYLG